MVSGHDEEWRPERVEVARGRLVLCGAPVVGEVAARHHEPRFDAADELADRLLERRIVEAAPRAEMEVRHVEDAR